MLFSASVIITVFWYISMNIKNYLVFCITYFMFITSGLPQNRFVNNYNSKIKSNISGYGTLTTNYSKQNAKNGNINKSKIITDGGINFDFGYNIFNDFTVGLDALFDTRYSKYYWQYDQSILQEIYTYFQNEYIRIEFGRLKDIAEKMQVSAPDVGLFGINDSYIYSTLLINNLYYNKKFFLNPSTNISFLKKRERISFITSNKYKLRFGASYSFPERQYISSLNKINPVINEASSISTKFSSNFSGNNRIDLSVGYAKYNNLYIQHFAAAKTRKEISTGIQIFIKGITFGTSVLKIDEIPFNNQTSLTAFNYSYEGWAYNSGIAFEFGPWAASLSYHGSIAEGSVANHKKDRTNMGLISMRRNLRQHLSFYTSIAGLMLENENKQKINKGISISIGTIFKF